MDAVFADPVHMVGTGAGASAVGTKRGSTAIALAMLSVLSGTGASPPPLLDRLPRVLGGTTARLVLDRAPVEDSNDSGAMVVNEDAEVGRISKTVSDQDTVRWIKATSGLTWDQMGRVFGVSRRAVHLWASGAHINATNAQVVHEFAAAIAAVAQTDPQDTRAALLAVGVDGRSIVDEFRRRRRTSAMDVSGTPFRPEELLGAFQAEVSSEE